MEKLLNADYWKKAYLLEFRLNGGLTDAFTFSVPPESEEFSFPQRKSETKTFGGAVVSDYGNDMVQINLSGSTINQELKLIYKSQLGTATMTGEQEIFYLRDLLKKYGSRDNLQNKEVYLYSLNGGGTKTTHNPKWWKIYVGQLDISRNKDKPFCYNYKFSASGVPEVTRKTLFKSFNKLINDWKSAMDSVLLMMNNVADELEEYGATFFSELYGMVVTFKSTIQQFAIAVERYTSLFSGVMDEADNFNHAVDTVMLGDKVLYSAYRYYPTVTADVWNSSLNVKNAADNIYNFCANIDEKTYSESSWQNVKELFDDSVTNIDIADVYSTLGHQAVLAANSAVEYTSKNLNDLGLAVIPGDTENSDELIITYGYKVVAITDAESSWDQLAQDYYGDSTLSYILATYNNLPTDKPLKPGQTILIPNLNYAESKASENEVYNAPDVKDNYGKDITISNNGDLGVYNGDVALVSGINNLEQALLNRYSTLLGARIRVETYGIQASIGDALTATSALIQASVHQTTVEDPRVERIEDISFNGKGDNLIVTVTYVDKNGTQRNIGGII